MAIIVNFIAIFPRSTVALGFLYATTFEQCTLHRAKPTKLDGTAAAAAFRKS